MDPAIEVDCGGMELLSEVQPLWEALFDRHVEYGAAGLPTIERELSWSRRLAHYTRIFAEPARATVFVARRGVAAVGYAVSYDEEFLGAPAVLLETLSLVPAVRGRGLGTRLIDLVDGQARERGAAHAIVDVVSGNTPAFGFYLNFGYSPHSETWMRSEQSQTTGSGLVDDLADRAKRHGLCLETEPGPDDTWVSSDMIAHLAPIPGNVANLPPETSALAGFLTALEDSGLWSIQVTIPATVESERWREGLKALRFKPCLHRLTRGV